VEACTPSAHPQVPLRRRFDHPSIAWFSKAMCEQATSCNVRPRLMIAYPSGSFAETFIQAMPNWCRSMDVAGFKGTNIDFRRSLTSKSVIWPRHCRIRLPHQNVKEQGSVAFWKQTFPSPASFDRHFKPKIYVKKWFSPCPLRGSHKPQVALHGDSGKGSHKAEETARVNLSHYHILAVGPRISTDLSGMTECNKAVVCPIINRDIRDRKGDSAER
jgi:hypothetical protein